MVSNKEHIISPSTSRNNESLLPTATTTDCRISLSSSKKRYFDNEDKVW